jgi:murein DD-endopeptidase MepM/ murein hydrolase activator NlpD
MEIILIANRRGAHAPLRLGANATLVLGLLLLVGFAGVACWSFSFGRSLAVPRVELSQSVSEEVRRQTAQIEEVTRTAQDDLNALSLRLGEMQARMIRLDALGGRLVDMARLDASEFDFESPPALGGALNPSALEMQSVTDFMAALEGLAAEIADRAPKLAALENLLMNEKLQADVHPTGRPVVRGWISSKYGYRADPVSGKKAFHSGLDFNGRSGSAVVAVASGVVIGSQYHEGLGNLVEINHGNGYVTRYGHNKKNLVSIGQTVKKGQVIALLGSSGRATGPHVHFEVLQDGEPVNPIDYVRASD